MSFYANPAIRYAQATGNQSKDAPPMQLRATHTRYWNDRFVKFKLKSQEASDNESAGRRAQKYKQSPKARSLSLYDSPSRKVLPCRCGGPKKTSA